MLIVKKLKEMGYRITKPRLAIIELLEQNEDMDAKEIHKLLKSKGHSIDVATVYRVLDLLCELGLVHKSNFSQQHAHFGFVKTLHAICRSCGKIIEYDWPDEHFKAQIENVLSFKAQDVFIEVYGLCSDCKESGNNNNV